MIESANTVLYKLRFLALGALIIVCLLLLPFLPHFVWLDPVVRANDNKSAATAEVENSLNNSPNVLTSGMLKGADELDQSISSLEQTLVKSLRSATSTLATATVQSGKFAARGAGRGVAFVAHATTNSVVFIANGIGDGIGYIVKTPVMGAVIRPGDNTPIPVIDTDAHALANADNRAGENVSQTATRATSDSDASWPVHGVITTEFGVPHWPYQPVHTGIDISTQKPSGVTSISPFRPGIVIETVYSNTSLGNLVIIDHGGGLTSAYAHLSSISVRVGQEVSKDTVLGYEGSTGVSTGSHLHFEIRVNGQPVDPRLYIDGQP